MLPLLPEPIRRIQAVRASYTPLESFKVLRDCVYPSPFSRLDGVCISHAMIDAKARIRDYLDRPLLIGIPTREGPMSDVQNKPRMLAN